MGIFRAQPLAAMSSRFFLALTLTQGLHACGPDQAEPDPAPPKPIGETSLNAPAGPTPPPLTLDYPEDGVLLGQGWNSFSVRPAGAVCIVFQEAESQKGQTKQMTLKSVTSDYELERSFGMDASVQYKAVAYDVSGKASFASSMKLNTSNSNISIYAVVDNGHRFVAPPKASDSAQIASLLKRGETPDAVNEALGTTAFDVGERWQTALPMQADATPQMRQSVPYTKILNDAANETESYRAIALHPDYVVMAAKDPAQFRKTCGDRFVQSISEGGEITGLFSFATTSLTKQQAIKASLQGSGWGVTADASAEAKVAEAAKDTKLTISAITTGGSGQDFPTDLEAFYKSIRTFPDAVAKAPWRYKVTVVRYEELSNWPGSGSGAAPDLAAMDQLAFHHGKWKTLQRTANTMLDATKDGLALSQGYLLGRGVQRADLLAMEALARKNRQALEKQIEDCAKQANEAAPCQPKQAMSRMTGGGDGPLASDYPLLTTLPLPIAGSARLQEERLLTAAALKTRIYDFWVKRTWDERCALAPSDEALCLPRAQVEALKDKIPVPSKNTMVLVSMINSKDHCASVNTQTNKVNWSACKPSSPSQQFHYRPGSKTFVNVATGTCLNVNKKSTKVGALLIVYSCGKNAAYKNDKWTLQKSDKNAWLLKPDHAPANCLSIRKGALKTGMQLGMKACAQNPWQEVNWVLTWF